jgi:glycosyltransferase involved in cell wall biosynthesis
MNKRIRILQVVGGMNRGGAETWLMHILRHLDADRFQMDFLVHQPGPFDFEAEIRSRGGRLLVCPGTRNPWSYGRNFRRIIANNGPFDIVHAHIQHYNGFVMRLARQAGVPVRIAHSHLDSSPERASAGFLRRMYFGLMDRWIEAHATLGIAVSKVAGAALFGADWETNHARRLLYCGIDLSAFQADLSPPAVRTALGIPADAFVIGHAGRMMEQKNHRFLIEIFAEIARREAEAHLLLIGEGPLRGAIEQQVHRLGLIERVSFAGVRSDVPRLMRGAMDLFLFPSLFEGLPLVGMEAQAAGLPMVISDVIAPELDILPELVHRLPLAWPARVWADKIQSVMESPRPLTAAEALARVADGPFNIETGIKELTAIYQQQVEALAPRVNEALHQQPCCVS